MSNHDIERYDIIKRLIRGDINGSLAAQQLRLSLRQTKRLKAGVKKTGATTLIHGNRGRRSNRRLSDGERRRIVRLVSDRYFDFSPTFAAEKLQETHGIRHDPKTIRSIMVDSGLWKQTITRKKQKHRAWRQRRANYGDLIQFDGSYEHWFEERSGEACLLAAIDDASGRIVHAAFAEHEGVVPVCGFWEDYLTRYGKPLAVYLDKFSTYRMNHSLAQQSADTLTQFQRAMQELHIEVIHANSPQAKGRVERLFQTLQDRLIKELRLRNISDIQTANTFLAERFIPAFNAKFAVEPRTRGDHHRRLKKCETKILTAVLCRQEERTVRNDFTISFQRQWYQLNPSQPVTVCKKDIVTVEERRDGNIHLRLRGKYLHYHTLPSRPRKVSQPQSWVLPATGRTSRKPATNHPWRLRMNADIKKHQLSKV
ncbi:ISNCY family transposase [Candidatus Uhrbacteria bacterium]|nr:ISNCY family transposase [Candidatus Uhrbacteria bacterium]